MKRTMQLTLLFSLACGGGSETASQSQSTQGGDEPAQVAAVEPAVSVDPGLNVDEGGVAAQGYDVVAYHQGTAAAGDAAFAAEYGGARYLFASQANLDAFEQDPAQYLPEFGGWCAFAVAEHGAKVPPNPDTFRVQDGRLLLFFNGPHEGQNVDTSEFWDAEPQARLTQADERWPTVRTQ